MEKQPASAAASDPDDKALPVGAEHDLAPETALRWYQEGRGAALASVVSTWGSAPRPAGSQLAISGQGDLIGSVSGGCVEGAVVEAALEAIRSGRPELLTFGVSDENAFAVGLACGGTIRILVEPVGPGAEAMAPALLEALVRGRREKRPLAQQVRLAASGRIAASRRLVSPGEEPLVDARFFSDRSGTDPLTGADEAGEEAFHVIHNPPLRLIVVGAVHIAAPLLTMARLCGYAPVLIEPRPAFASPARFPGSEILEDWPDEAMAALAPDARCAVVTLSHDAKFDDPAILAALASPAFYLGCLGSRRTHAKRLERLRAAGTPEAQIARIHAPVGLDIGAVSPGEIAVSIMAEITAVLRGRGAG